MFLKILLLAILLVECFVDATDEIEKDPLHCDQLKNHFARSNANFTHCVLDNNENATFCVDCVETYALTVAAYNNLMTANETKDGKPCRFRFVDVNQLDLLEKIFEYSKRLWEIGDCPDCFSSSCDLLNYSSETCPHSNHTVEFENLLKNVTDCFESTHDTPSNKSTLGNNTCSHCTDQYTDLSNFYNSIRLKTTDKFCFSMKFWMNTTQQHWANYLHCCEERKSSSLEDFSLASSFSITLSIAFYIFTFIMGKRKERIQEIPNDLMPPQDADESGETVMNINSDEPTTSAANLATNSKILNSLNDAHSSDDGDTDDEDILPIQNTNLIEIGQ